jgi:hypothetical protein
MEKKPRNNRQLFTGCLFLVRNGKEQDGGCMSLYFVVGFMAIRNEPLELIMKSLVWGEVTNIQASIKVLYKLLITNMAMVQNF